MHFPTGCPYMHIKLSDVELLFEMVARSKPEVLALYATHCHLSRAHLWNSTNCSWRGCLKKMFALDFRTLQLLQFAIWTPLPTRCHCNSNWFCHRVIPPPIRKRGEHVLRITLHVKIYYVSAKYHLKSVECFNLCSSLVSVYGE